MDRKFCDKTYPNEKRRAVTAAADYKRQSKQMKLIGTLRQLIIGSAEISSSITSSDKSLGAEALKTSNIWAAHQAKCFKPLSDMQPLQPSERPKQSRRRRGDNSSLEHISLDSKLVASRQGNLLKRGDTLVDAGGPQVTKSAKAEDVSTKKSATVKRKTYSEHLQILKGRKMKLQRSSTDYSALDSAVDEPLEIDTRGHVTECEEVADEVKPAERSLTCLSISNVTSYQSVLDYTKRRVNKSSSAPQKLTHTSRRPHIVIPCHTNIECKHCQLYDEPEETETPDEVPDWQPPQANNWQPSKANSTLHLLLKESEKGRTMSLDSKHAVCSTKLPVVANNHSNRQRKEAPVNVIEKYSRSLQPSYNRISSIQQRINERRSKGRDVVTESVSADILPKIYKLRYTKSSHLLTRPHYGYSETTAAE